jgi:SRSO17 transposase
VEERLKRLCLSISHYLLDFEPIMRSKTRNSLASVEAYFHGLFKAEKKKATCTGIADTLPNVGSQNLNHMLSDSGLDAQALMDAVALRTCKFFEIVLLALREEVGLIIDEVGFKKKGKKSACVGRQWLGSIGKQDNGQVAVAAVLCCGELYSLVNQSLFMPEDWADDVGRRKDAGIPESVKFQTKPRMALEMIKKAITDKVRFGFVGFDALYGICFWLLDELDRIGVKFMGDIRTNTGIYLSDPKPSVPEWSGKGKMPKLLKANTERTTTEAYCKGLEEKDWQLVAFREGTKGDMQALFHSRAVWIWDEEKDYAQKYRLVIRKSLDGADIKYSLTNDHDASLKTNAFRQGQRYFVEKTFKEGKNQVGLGDYQVRSWDGFHRHMAICMLALNFLMEEKHALRPDLKFVTAEDIRLMIAFMLPDRRETVDDMVGHILRKHDEYAAQIHSDRKRAKQRATNT